MTLPLPTLIRLTAWRELHARGLWLIVCAAVLALDVLLPERTRGAWDLFALLVVLPPVALALALRAPADADAFWRGLGGAAWARALTTAACQLVPLALTAGLLLLSLAGRGEALGDVLDVPLATPLYASALLAIWALVFAGRSVAGGLVALALLLFAGPTVTLMTFLGGEVLRWPAMPALIGRLLLLGGCAITMGALLEGPYGAWGGAVRKRTAGGWLPVAALALALLGTGAADAAWPASWGGGGSWVVAPDGEHAWLRSTGTESMRWPHDRTWSREGGLSWSADRSLVEVGPRGATLSDEELVLSTGQRIERCWGRAHLLRWAPGGEAALMQWVPRGGAPSPYTVVDARGCHRLPEGTSTAALAGDGVLVTVTDGVLRTGPIRGKRAPVPLPGAIEGAETTVVAREGAVLVRQRLSIARPGTLRPRWGGAALWHLSGTQVTELLRTETNIGIARQGLCALAEGTLRCWDPQGRPNLGPIPWARLQTLPLGGGWLWNLPAHRLERPRDGSAQPLPGAADGRLRGEYVVVLESGDARFFASDGRVHELPLPR